MKGTLVSNLRNYITTRCYRRVVMKKEKVPKKTMSPVENPDCGFTPELDDWIRQGNRVSLTDLQHTIHNLRRGKRYSEALQVSEWMKSRYLCVFTPNEHAIHLNLIGKARGFVDAFGYYMSLKEQDKTEKTYGALLHCDVGRHTLSHLLRMKESGVASSSLTNNDVMSLYSYGTGLLMELACLSTSWESFKYSRSKKQGKYRSKESQRISG